MRTRVAAAGVLALILAGGVSAATQHMAAATATVTVKLPVANRQVFGIITLRGTGRTRAPGALLKITGARDRSLPAGIRAGAGVAATSVSGRVRTWVVAFAINNLGGAAVHSLQSAGDGPAALPLKLSTSGAAATRPARRRHSSVRTPTRRRSTSM